MPTTNLLTKANNCANLLSDNTAFNKGDIAYHVTVSSRDRESGKITIRIRRLRIESFGKKKGTATEEGTFLKRNLCPEYDILSGSMEDAWRMAEELGLYESARHIAASIRSDKHWLAAYAKTAKPEIATRVKDRLARLLAATPTFDAEVAEGRAFRLTKTAI
jgi:hypothetical protein